MSDKKIPIVPKRERSTIDVGYHKIPDWLILLLLFIIFIYCYLNL